MDLSFPAWLKIVLSQRQNSAKKGIINDNRKSANAGLKCWLICFELTFKYTVSQMFLYD